MRSATDINQRYRTLRPQLLMYMVIGYAAFYLTRKSVNYVLPALQTDLGLDKGDIGLLGSLFYLTYGLSKFTAGLWHDSHGQRWFMGAGLFATGLLNVVFAFGESLTLLLAVWTLNGFFRAGAGLLRPPANPLVLAQRTRLLVGLLEYVDQHRRGDYPAD